MKILVTGGAGFIGSHVAQELLNRKDSVVVVDNLNDCYSISLKKYNLSFIKKARFYGEDIRDKQKLEYILKKEKINAIIHLAAMAGVRNSILNTALYEDVNIKGTLNLLELSKKFKIKNFIFASSSSVYGNNKKVPFSETDAANNPISPYAATKRAAELLCYTYNDLYNIPITCLRFFTVYGPRGRPEMAIFKFIKAISQNKQIPVYGCGKMSRDFTYIDDITRGILGSLEKNKDYNIINLGDSNPINQMDLISLIEKNLNKKAKMKKLPMQEGDVNTTYADISKAKKLLKWEPSIPIEEGIKKTINWFNKNKKFLYSI